MASRALTIRFTQHLLQLDTIRLNHRQVGSASSVESKYLPHRFAAAKLNDFEDHAIDSQTVLRRGAFFISARIRSTTSAERTASPTIHVERLLHLRPDVVTQHQASVAAASAFVTIAAIG